jgi:hypothetical protein
MPKNTKRNAEPTIPLQIRVSLESREKLKAIAAENGLSLNDISTMCLAAGLGKVASKLREIRKPEEAVA